VTDLVVENTFLLELKSVQVLNKVMEAHVINYLRFSKMPVGYLINYRSTRVDRKRYVHQRE
jgi:GxxExxY protein